MATLLDEEFLADLDDLSDDEPAEKAKAQDGEDEEEDTLKFGMDIEGLNYDDLSTHAKLTSSDRYQDIMQRVRAMRADDATKGSGSDSGGDAAAVAPSWRGPSNEEPAYRLLVECNQLAVDIDNEIAIMHNYLRDRFRPRFPELQELVQTPIEYSRVVRRIGNQMDITDVELDDLLPAATVMVVTVTASTTNGKPLAPEELQRVHQTCDMAEQLDQDKLEILRFVESRMSSIAPNLTKVLGSEIAAKLMGLAGGLLQLSQIPACNIKVLGQKRRNLAGYSAATAGKHQGYVYDCDLVQNSPKALREKVQRLVANKITLVARFDAYGRDPAGAKGEEFRAEIVKTIERWQEPPPAKTSKPLPKPDAESKKRRGGRRLRKMKERYGLTEMRKAANRVEFNKQEEEVMDGDDVVGLGMLGQNSGRLRIVAAQQKVKLNRKSQAKVRARSLGGGSGATSGLSSSLAFTPVQGIELENPSAHLGNSDAVADRADGTESYFSDLSGFRSLAAKPK